ncbi:integrin alpha-6 isoform X1 [Xenopus laevis]|uniref:Integrin alpha-6 isoform X1 n=1 Tax=Xenopus laevis TaxID=8355 RepID=A0A8J0U0N0_XENLA|nr:integrin alpha-6 isoform X1 [Xenopus laevis]
MQLTVARINLLLGYCCAFIAAFNLDTQNVITKSGDTGSLFGFSLAMHWQLDPDNKKLLLVGSPRAKAFSAQKANVTGGLYVCDIKSPSRSCDRVLFDNSVDVNVESKENQWMGVSVQSQGPGGKIVTCAHRYERRTGVNTNYENRDITGRCYVFSQDLTIKDEMDGGEWRFCEGRRRGHEQFGSCQQGVAATFTKDFHYIVFGAPGTYNWKGVVRAEQKNNTLEDLFNIFEDGPYETGGENKRDSDLVPAPDNSYLGFSLDTGVGITSQNEMIFVAGAPRANHSGAVVLLRKFPPDERMLSAVHTFQGEGLASSFGYDVAVVDLNRDGWKDLVVGAPQYFDKNDREIGGAIYVYINNMGNWNDVKPVRIVGTKDSMFGISAKNIGDINQDGFPDIAVGAPYDDGFGKVYVYHGSKDGIITEPAQVIEGRSTNTRFFGYSIAGNLDLDGNSYPDIAVGSLSDTVKVFRSRPVITIKKTIKVTPDKIDFNKKNCDAPSGICLDVEACFEYTANPKDYNPVLTLSYTFELENDRRQLQKPLRMNFKELPQESKLSKTIELRGQNQKRCVTTALQLLEGIIDKLHPIDISVSTDIKNVPRKKRQSSPLPELMPILNSNEPKTSTANAQFLKEGCGEDNICNSNMQLKYKFLTREGSQGSFTELNKESGVPVLALKNQKEIALEITVTNKPSDPANPKMDGDDAHEAQLTAELPSSLSYSRFQELNPQLDKMLQCVSNPNGSVVSCELGNPFKRNANVTFYLILSTNEISVDTNELNIDLNLKTTSSQVKLAPVVAKARVMVELLLSVSGVAKPSQVYFGGNVIGESAMKSEEDIGNLIEFDFRVTNFGRPLKALGTTFLNIQWPKEIHNGKWLLYLVKIESNGLDKMECQPAGEINKLRLLESGKTRHRREIGESQSGTSDKSFSLFSERKYMTLDCNNQANCVTIKCPLHGMDSNAVIKARSRLWNSTFLEEYSKMNYLDILVKAFISVDTAAQNVKLANEGYQVRVTVFPEKTVAQYSGVPWWIIFVSILAGILLLAVLVFLLWKLGFFKRSRYDDSVPRYHAVRISKEEREYKDGKLPNNSEKKQWVTKWNENESYS